MSVKKEAIRLVRDIRLLFFHMPRGRIERTVWLWYVGLWLSFFAVVFIAIIKR